MRPYLEPGQWDAFLAHCRPAHRVRAGFILETGLRAGEALAMRWDWVQTWGERPSVRVAAEGPAGWRSKGRRVRAVPLTAQAQSWLAAAAERWGTDGYVLHQKERPMFSGRLLAPQHLACEKMGLDPHVDTHGLRRSAAVRWLSMGLTLDTISRLLGHSSVLVTEQSYAGLAPGHLADAMALVDRRAGELGAKFAAPTAAPICGKAPPAAPTPPIFSGNWRGGVVGDTGLEAGGPALAMDRSGPLVVEHLPSVATHVCANCLKPLQVIGGRVGCPQGCGSVGVG